MKTKSVKDVTEQPQARPGVSCSDWLAGINESETKAWDNMRVKEDALQRATEELREATREWAIQYSIILANSGERTRAIRLVMDATGWDSKQAEAWLKNAWREWRKKHPLIAG